MNNDNSTFDFEDRTYINPDLSRDEQTQFIETLRGMQDRNAQEIGRETHALGTNVPSNLGGLGGAEETWNARYQEPQMNEVAAQLKTAAQQTALNNALSNYSNMLQNRYDQAYRDYQKRAYDYNRKNSGGGGSTTNPTNPYTAPQGDVDINPDNTTKRVTAEERSNTKDNDGYTPENMLQEEVYAGKNKDKIEVFYDQDAYEMSNTGAVLYGVPILMGAEVNGLSFTRAGFLNYLRKMDEQGQRVYDGNGRDITDSYKYLTAKLY